MQITSDFSRIFKPQVDISSQLKAEHILKYMELLKDSPHLTIVNNIQDGRFSQRFTKNFLIIMLLYFEIILNSITQK